MQTDPASAYTANHFYRNTSISDENNFRSDCLTRLIMPSSLVQFPVVIRVHFRFLYFDQML